MNRVIRRIQCYFVPVLFMLIGMVVANNFMPTDSSAAVESGRGVATLEERLLNGLRARTDQEKEYVKQVVTYVQQGKLPEKLVDSTFLWVRKNKPKHNYPIFYFKRILELRAKALNLEVPQ